MGTLVALAIPFKDFREKIRITKQYQRQRISVFKGFVIIEF